MISWLKFFLLLLSPSLFALPQIKSLSPLGAQRGTEVQFQLSGDHLNKVKNVFFYDARIQAKELKFQDEKLNIILNIPKDVELGMQAFRLVGEDGLSYLSRIEISDLPEIKKNKAIRNIKQAQEFSAPCIINGQLDNRHKDHYLFHAKKGQVFSFATTSIKLARGFNDLTLEILSPDGKRLKKEDDSTLLKQDPILTFTAPKDGEYFLSIHNVLFGGGAYRIQVINEEIPHLVYPLGGSGKQTIQAFFPSGKIKKIDIQTTGSESIIPLHLIQNNIHPIQFHDSKLPNTLENQESDNKEAAAASTHFPGAFNGILEKDNDVDWFAFTAKESGQVEFKVMAEKLNSLADTVLQIYHENGKMIKNQDDTQGLDPSITLKVDKDKKYFLRINEKLKRGRADFVYRITYQSAPKSLTLELPPTQIRTQKDQYLNIPIGANKLVTFNLLKENTSDPSEIKINKLIDGMSYRVLKAPENSPKKQILFSLAPDAKPFQASLLDFQLSNKDFNQGHYKDNLLLVTGPNNTEYVHYRAKSLAMASHKSMPFSLNIEHPHNQLPRLGSIDLKVKIKRAEGFDKEVTLKLKNIIPDLSGKDQIKIPNDKSEVIYTIQAGMKTPTDTWPIIFDAICYPDSLHLAQSSEPIELKILGHFFNLKMPQNTLKQGKTKDVTIDLGFAQECDFPIEIEFVPNTHGVGPQKLTLKEKTDKLKFTIKATPDARPGYHKNSYVKFNFAKDGKAMNQIIRTNGVIYIPNPKKSLK